MSVLSRERTALVVIDVQEGFRKAVDGFAETARAAGVLLEGARILGVPAVVTEQYPKGLGHSVEELGLDGEPVLEKTAFAASRADGFDLDGRPQALVCGIEAHVCVHQTVQDLLGQGVEVHVCADAVASRDPRNRELALQRAEKDGAVLTSVEMALLELCERAGTPEFRHIQALIK